MQDLSYKNFDYISMYNMNYNPSTIHVSNTGLSWYFKKYLAQKLISIFKFNNLPEHWSFNYFIYTLLIYGYIAVINTDKFGIIPQHCGLGGYNLDVMYQPTRVIISNPLIDRTLEPRINKECALIKMQPNYCGAWDMISYYGDLLALASETASVNLVNSKLGFVFIGNSNNQIEGFKRAFDNLNSGSPAVFLDKQLFNEDGSPNWVQFNQNLKQNYIVGDLMADMHRIMNMFNTDIGIPNANYEKSERLITDEVNANNVDTMSKASLWCETIQKGLDIANQLYGLNISVELAYKKHYEATDDKVVINDE